MKSAKDNNIIFVRLQPDENLIDCLQKICHQYTIKSAVILSGIGQVKKVTLGYFKKKGDYSPKKFSDVYELLSLSGTIIHQNDEYLTHLHAVIGDIDKNGFGGHLIEATVEVTNEIVILATQLNAVRRKSETTGLMELDFFK